MRKFTLTAIAIKDEKVVGVFKVLEQTPKFDGALLSCALSKFVELPYQELVFDPSKVVFADLHWLRSNFGKLSVDELAFSVWRAATALRNSNALEVEGVKHGSNWLVKLDDEPFDVKFVLEDQAQNYIVLNVLPDLEPTVVIEDSGWLHNNVEAQPTVQLSFVTTGLWPVTEETVEVVQLDEDTKRDPNALLSAAPQCTETGIRDSSQFGDKGVADTNGFARPKEVPEHNQAVGGLGHESPTLEAEEDTAETAVLPDTVHEPARISSVGEAMKMKNELEFSQEDPGPTEILAAFKKGYLDGAKSTALVPSEEVHETAKALVLESNPVHNYYKSESDVPTNHTELSQPPLEI